MDFHEIQSIVSKITYKPNWEILLKTDIKGVFIQLNVVDTLDIVTLERTSWKSGKRYLSKHMCRQEFWQYVRGLNIPHLNLDTMKA